MERLILVRYGQYENGHLTEEGRGVMTVVAERIKDFLDSTKPLVISAPTPRATESAEIIAASIGAVTVHTYSEIYAADEEGLLPDCEIASELIDTLAKNSSTIVAVVSREYIETLPSYILEKILGSEKVKTSLSRGEALVLNYHTKKISYLR